MKLTIQVPKNQNRIVRGSYEFVKGRVYMCVKTPGDFSEYFGAFAWKQNEANEALGLDEGRVYSGIVNNSIKGAHSSGLSFTTEYHFEELPLGTTLIVSHEIEVKKRETVDTQLVF